jgi:cobalt-zinc-cadmium efflux system outer membrane protein
LLGLALGSGLPASPNARAAGRSLTLPQAIELALQRNTDARAAQADVKSAHGALEQSTAFENPGLFVSALGTQVNPATWPKPNQFGVTWTLPIGGKRGAGIASAEAGLSAARATQTSVVQQLELNVAQAFVTVLLDQSLLDFAQQDQASFRETLALDEVRYKDGQIAYGELLKLKLQALAIDDAVQTAASTKLQARADLAQLLGTSADEADLVLEGELAPVTAPALGPGQLVSQALAQRPDVKAADAETRSAKASLSQQRRQPIPDLGILADYNHAAGDPDSFDLQLSVSIPLLDRNGGNVEQAEAALTKAQLTREALELGIRTAAVKALEELRASQVQLAAYQAGVKLGRESLEISRHAFHAGSGSLLDFLDAETSYRQVEVAYRNAIAREAVAAYNLRFIAGQSLP